MLTAGFIREGTIVHVFMTCVIYPRYGICTLAYRGMKDPLSTCSVIFSRADRIGGTVCIGP